MPWLFEDLVTVFTEVNCGVVSIEFFNADATNTPFDIARFNDLRASPNNF